MSRDAIYIQIQEKERELRGISPKLSVYKQLQKEISDLKERTGDQKITVKPVRNYNEKVKTPQPLPRQKSFSLIKLGPINKKYKIKFRKVLRKSKYVAQ